MHSQCTARPSTRGSTRNLAPVPPTPPTPQKLHEAMAAGQISEEDIDRAVGRILRSMYAAGLFDNPAQAARGDRLQRGRG